MQQIPHNFEVVVHLAAAAHHIADIVLVAIAGAARQCVLFKHMDVLALHLTIAHQIAGSGQSRQTGADDIGGFVIHALRLFGVCKSFVVATGIVHKKASLLQRFVFHSLRRAVLYGNSIPRKMNRNNKQTLPCV